MKNILCCSIAEYVMLTYCQVYAIVQVHICVVLFSSPLCCCSIASLYHLGPHF